MATEATATIVCPDLSVNCLGRAHVLGRLLQPRYEVTVVGPATGPLWAPLRDDRHLSYKAVPLDRHGFANGRDAWRKVAQHVIGDVVYVSKPFATSLWAARQRKPGAALMLDIDDWEVGILRQQLAQVRPIARPLQVARLRGMHHREPWNVLAGAAAARRVRHRTVSNRFLQRRYGGALVLHARDASEFDPARFDAAKQKRRFGVEGRRTVLFLGTPRLHKGIEDLVEAVALLPDRDVLLWVVGLEPGTYEDRLAAIARARLGDRVRLDPALPFSDAPAVLAAADVVVIPQRDDPAARGQMPAKVFDAMAMQRPLVVTDLSDLREAVGNGGRVVPPGTPAALAEAVAALLADDAAARRTAAAARARFLAHYSLDAVRRDLEPTLRAAIAQAEADA